VIGGFLQYNSKKELVHEIRSNAKKIETDLTKRLNKAENKVDSLQKENVAILKNNNVLQDSIKKLKP
jgi:guanylate kinase